MAAEETPESPIVGEAATVVVLRDGPGGVEVLMLKRPHSGTFAGAWVFPGGRVDPEDAQAHRGAQQPGEGADEADWSARGDISPGEAAGIARAALRETAEETGIPLAADALVPISRWVPPLGAPKRLRTWFFLAAHPGGEVRLNPGEHVGWEWLAPTEVLERHAAGAVILAPPTWVTLHALRDAPSVTAALETARAQPFERFFSRALRGEDGVEAVVWAGDAEYGGAVHGDPNPAGAAEHRAQGARADEHGPARHRLWIASLPWRYERTSPELLD
ncbi:NUDIX hydrolase [Sinomonas halotolerans]|uniref:NUDIX hydrolase n=1 Tax=Sinomonas halotolerans TaxID=1644133 RepID=A0ABU9WZ58_9MICC